MSEENVELEGSDVCPQKKKKICLMDVLFNIQGEEAENVELEEMGHPSFKTPVKAVI